jgi:hypothetical protein
VKIAAAHKVSIMESYYLTEKLELFSDAEFTGFYRAPDQNFAELNQQELLQVLEDNESKPLKDYREENFELFPGELFFEKSFQQTEESIEFVKGFFKHFKNLDITHCQNILERLLDFIKTVGSHKKLNCRFEVLSGNSCEKFHVDEVDARLIYTCSGPGTQLKLADDNTIKTLPTGSSIILKGTQYPNFKLLSLHRSPPIEAIDVKRFLFIADYV